MKNIIILVPETAVPAAIFDPYYMFTAINEFYKNAGHDSYFNVILAGLTKEILLNNGLLKINPDKLIDEIQKADLIIVPAVSGSIKAALELNKAFLPFIIEHYKNGSEVASLCIGSFLLASTELLKGKSCSTHWLHANSFRSMFPDVKLTDDRIITEQNGIYTSGGASSYWNLLLYIVEKYTSREMAVMASKFFLLDIERNSQLPFSMFNGQKEHGDSLILEVQEYIEKNFRDKITVDEITSKFNIGRRTFERRFKSATANTVIEYIQRVKIESAKKQLESGRKTVSEVMYNVGYSDTKAFRDVFKKITGMSPVDYRKKYNQ